MIDIKCSNCGKKHRVFKVKTDNHYCGDCAKFFMGLGAYDYINGEGRLSKTGWDKQIEDWSK